jgi:hypothetical protein
MRVTRHKRQSLLFLVAGSGWELSEASGIDDAGQIMGYGTFEVGYSRWQPARTPSSSGCRRVVERTRVAAWKRCEAQKNSGAWVDASAIVGNPLRSFDPVFFT